MHNLINKLKALPIFFALLLLATSCSQNKDEKANESKLAAIDDSIGSKSPNARAMLASAMKEAKDSISYYEVAVRLAKYYMLSSTPDSAFTWLKQTEQFAGKPANERERSILAYAYNTEASYLHYFHKDTDRSIKLYQKSYSLLMQSSRKDEAPNVCANLGDAYNYKNLLPDAAKWYRRALFLTDSLHLPSKENVTLYMGLAMIYQQLGDNQQALDLYKRTDQHFDEMTVSMQAYFLNNYGCYYYYIKDYPNSLKMYLRLKKHLEDNKMENNFDMYLCKLNLADVYLNLDDYKNAQSYLEEVEPFWKKNGDPTALYYCNTIRLGIATGRGDTSAAGRIVRNDGNSKNIMFAMRQIRNRYLREYFEQEGNWHAAYENLQSDIVENDSLEHNRINMRAADIMAQYNQDTIQLHNSLRMEHKEAEVTAARMWLVITIASIVILLMVVVVLILRSHRRQLRNQMQVMQLRLESARNRISPHFVFNVLNNRIVGADHKEADELFDLSKLIRTNLDMAGNMTVTLYDELDFVAKYIKVERKLLADDDFVYNLNITDGIDTKKILVPSMFIQILVENSFVHGLMGRKGHKALDIDIEQTAKATSIKVIDNGPGFDMRSSRSHSRTGLNVIRQTIAIINDQNRQKIQFALHNRTNDDGSRAGCEASLIIPNGIKYPL